MDSEGLLALPALQQVQGLDIGLVTAPGGRGEIAPVLQARGAHVLRADVYARDPVALAPRALQQLDEVDAPLALALSSGEALQRVLAALPATLAAKLRGAHVAAASERLRALAREQGFTDVDLAAGPRPAQLLAALAGRRRVA
jgi:uroporphyrinogen-III synthase